MSAVLDGVILIAAFVLVAALALAGVVALFRVTSPAGTDSDRGSAHG